MLTKSANTQHKCSYVQVFHAEYHLDFTIKVESTDIYIYIYIYIYAHVGRVAQSVYRLTTSWTVRDRIPVWTTFSSRPDRPWGPPSLLYNGYRIFPGVKCGRGVMLTTHPLLVPRSWKSKAIPLPTLWATPGL